MNTPNTNLIIEAVRPKDLSRRELVRIAKVSQDMWACVAGLWEFVQCNHCRKIHSREDVFWKWVLSSKTVDELMQYTQMKEILCHACGKDTRMIYGEKHVQDVQDRLLNSVDAFLVVCRNKLGEIVGFKDGYVADLPTIFERELKYHYHRIGLEEIQLRVERILWHMPDRLLAVSSVGLLEPYRNFSNLFEAMHQFTLALPDEYMDMPGIAELDKGNVLYRMCKILQTWTPMGILEDPLLGPKISNVGEKYNSELLVYSGIVRAYKEGFTHGQKHFLRLSRPPRTSAMDDDLHTRALRPESRVI